MLCLLGLEACIEQQTSSYLYPREQDSEVNRICQIALTWNKRSFSVIHGKIQIINPRSSPYIDLRRPLSDGFYHCGSANPGRLPCAKGTTQTLSGERCSF